MHDIGFCIIVDSFLLSNQSYSSLESPRGKLIEVICPTVSVVYHSKNHATETIKGIFVATCIHSICQSNSIHIAQQ